MKRPRGYVMFFGLILLAIMLSAVLLLGRAMESRRHSQHSASQRTVAVASGEGALEQARAQLNSGTLQPGNSIVLDGCTIVCASLKNGVVLDTVVPFETETGRPAPKSAVAAQPPREAVRVRWTLTSSGAAANGTQWSVAEWNIQNETLR